MAVKAAQALEYLEKVDGVKQARAETRRRSVQHRRSVQKGNAAESHRGSYRGSYRGSMRGMMPVKDRNADAGFAPVASVASVASAAMQAHAQGVAGERALDSESQRGGRSQQTAGGADGGHAHKSRVGARSTSPAGVALPLNSPRRASSQDSHRTSSFRRMLPGMFSTRSRPAAEELELPLGRLAKKPVGSHANTGGIGSSRGSKGSATGQQPSARKNSSWLQTRLKPSALHERDPGKLTKRGGQETKREGQETKRETPWRPSSSAITEQAPGRSKSPRPRRGSNSSSSSTPRQRTQERI